MKMILTCDPGFEDVVEKELKEKIRNSKFLGLFKNFKGKVLIDIESNDVTKLFSLRSIHHIMKLIFDFKIQSLDESGLKEIYDGLMKIDISKELINKKTFRITSQRVGDHTFTSMDVQRIAGEAILKKYGKKVDLKNFDVNIRVDVFGHEVFVSVQLTKESLFKRFKRVFNHPAGIKPTIAYGLISLSKIRENEVLLDPMCGGGTIVIEAASIFKDKIKVIGGDINPKFIDGAKKNAKENNLDNFIEFKVLDARKLSEYFDEKSIDVIISNPPYGIRMKPKGLKQLYFDFLMSSYDILKDDGRLVVLTIRAESFRIIVFRTKRYKIVEERVVESGGLFPHVFILEKL